MIAALRSLRWRTAFRFPGILGSFAFLGYVGWNIKWLVESTIPPSILIGVLGVPAPTTGMTRSVRALFAGNWSESLLWNPLTLPFCALLMWTACEVLCKWWRRDRLVLSTSCSWCWPGILAAAWIAKFVIGQQWW